MRRAHNISHRLIRPRIPYQRPTFVYIRRNTQAIFNPSPLFQYPFFLASTKPTQPLPKMCITFWYTPTVPSPNFSSTSKHSEGENSKSPYAFILLSNRDLELGRPAFDASWHSFEQITPHSYGRSKLPLPRDRNQDNSDGGKGKGRRILSGRDAADPVGGTWLGLGAYSASSAQPRTHARIGVLTNIHDDSPVPKGTRTRGCLIKDWLLGNSSDASEGDGDGVDPEEGTKRYLDGLKDEAVALAGFNLLVFDIALSTPETEGEAETRSTQITHVSAHQLTNRYRPHPTSPPDGQTIPADKSTINTSHTSRTLPTSPNPSHASTSPLGTFRSAITDLRPTALRLGGMSNSLMEEPFEKVVVGTGEFEEILEREFADGVWDERREEKLLRELFGLMRCVCSSETMQKAYVLVK